MELRNNDDTLALPTATATTTTAITAICTSCIYRYIEVTEVSEVTIPRRDSDFDSNIDSDPDAER